MSCRAEKHPYTWVRKVRREGGELERLLQQLEGADGDTVLGLETSSEWEAQKESSDREKG